MSINFDLCSYVAEIKRVEREYRQAGDMMKNANEKLEGAFLQDLDNAFAWSLQALVSW